MPASTLHSHDRTLLGDLEGNCYSNHGLFRQLYTRITCRRQIVANGQTVVCESLSAVIHRFTTYVLMSPHLALIEFYYIFFFVNFLYGYEQQIDVSWPYKLG